MKIGSDLFELETEEEIDFFFDVLEGSIEDRSLYFTRKTAANSLDETFVLGVFEFVSGHVSKGLHDEIFLAKKREVENFAGEIQKQTSDFPLEFSTSFNLDGSHYKHHYLLKDSGSGFALLVTLLPGFNNQDLEMIRKVMSQVKLNTLSVVGQKGDFLQINMLATHGQIKIGNRVLLNPVTA
jgi:hypothetical protein